ncbi:hypothetical protein GCM10028819_39230 [Spirosoma humi]
MRPNRLLLVCGLLVLMGSCGPFHLGEYSQGVFPETVTNLGAINSVDDDYNSTAPAFGTVIPLLFSSKRGGRSDFNFVKESLNYSFDKHSEKFSWDNKPYGGWDILQEQRPIGWAGDKANSDANELGPYIKSYERDLIKDGMGGHYAEYLMLFASDRTGNLDIYLIHNYQDNLANTPVIAGSISALDNKQVAEPVPLSFLNSPADDAYPTFDKTYSSLYFTSNRAGSFDIYKAAVPSIAPSELHTRLPALSNVPIERVAELSSTADDKCPFILNDMLVFTSNRPGGQGGYDLYYSKWEAGRWSAPVNFGPTVNTASDEYRPILSDQPDFSNRLMIFSSNRPGGKGGYDLYMIGLPK